MKRFFSFLCIFCCSLTAFSAPKGQPVDGYAAEVNGRIITVADVIEHTRGQMREVLAEHRGNRQELVQKQEKVFSDGVEELVNRKLILAKFESMGAQIPRSAVRDYKERILRDRFDNDRPRLLAVLREMGMTEVEWEQDLHETIVEQSMISEYVQSKVLVTPSEVRAEYEKRLDTLQTDVELKLRAIAFRPAPQGGEEERERKIATATRLVLEGKDFGEVAETYSEGPKAHAGGDQGWLSLDTLPGPIKDAVKDLKVGEISELVNLPTQSYLFKVDNSRGGEVQTLAQAQSSIEADIRARKQEELYEELVQALRKEFPVHYYDPDISSVTGE